MAANYRDLSEIVKHLAEAETHLQQSFASSRTALQVRQYENLGRDFDGHFCRTLTEAKVVWKHLMDAMKLLEKHRNFRCYDADYSPPYRPENFCEVFLSRPIPGAKPKNIMGDFQFSSIASPRDLVLIDKSKATTVATMFWESDNPHVLLSLCDGNEQATEIQDIIKAQAARNNLRVIGPT